MGNSWAFNYFLYLTEIGLPHSKLTEFVVKFSKSLCGS